MRLYLHSMSYDVVSLQKEIDALRFYLGCDFRDVKQQQVLEVDLIGKRNTQSTVI